MNYVWVLPGAGGSELFRTLEPFDLIWVSKKNLLKFGVKRMSLDNSAPPVAPPGAINLSATRGLPDYYDPIVTGLTEQLDPKKWQIRMYGWDWRRSIPTEADKMYTLMKNYFNPGDFHHLVCHSAGGLLARYVYSNALSDHNEGFIGRICCAGTPHQGCMATAQIFCNDYPPASSLYKYSVLLSALGSVLGGALADFDLANTAVTWPAFYELLPRRWLNYKLNDPSATGMWNADWWPSWLNISQKYLDTYWVNQWNNLDLDTTRPPGGQLCNLIGRGFKTKDVENTWFHRSEAPMALFKTADGDGTVTVENAKWNGHTTGWLTDVSHEDLLLAGVESGWVKARLLEFEPDIPPAPFQAVEPKTAAMKSTVPSFVDPPTNSTDTGVPTPQKSKLKGKWNWSSDQYQKRQ